MVNRDKLQRAGEDNLFVRLLYAKDRAQTPKNQDEQEKLGKLSMRFARAVLFVPVLDCRAVLLNDSAPVSILLCSGV